MAKLLDLIVFQQQFFPIKLLDGTTINLKKPSQKLLMKFVAFQNVVNKGFDEQIDSITMLVVDVLNNNANGRTFTSEDLQEYDIAILQAIIQGYTQFLNEVMSNPN